MQRLKQRARHARTKLKRARREGGIIKALLEEYSQEKAKVKAKVKEVLRRRAEELVDKIEKLKTSDPKQCWKLLKEAIGTQGPRQTATMDKVVDAKGAEHKGSEVKEVVREAFKALGIEDMEDDKFDKKFALEVRRSVRRAAAERIRQDELDEKFTMEELRAVLKKLKAGKATGVDEIMAEWMKYGGEKMTYALWVLCNHVWLTEACPEQWGQGAICLLFKDGDKRDPLNYRGITLLSVVGKVFASLVNVRLMAHCEEGDRLVDEQAGFRKGRACADQIFIMKEVLTARKGKKKTFTCFIDVKKAYDRVSRDGLWAALWGKNVRGKMWRVLRNYYAKVQSCVIVNGERSDWFGIDVGVRQGCVLSPILFDVFIDGLARAVKALGLGVKVDAGNHSPSYYADDVVITADTYEDLQKMMNAVNEFCRKARLQLNEGKTKMVVFGQRGLSGRTLKCGDMTVGEAAEYKYLGLVFEKNGWKKQKEKMVRQARRMAAMAWGMLVQTGKMSTEGKLTIYKALVRPHVEYGAEVVDAGAWEEAEEMQRWVGKRILLAGKRIPDEVVQGELGLLSLRGRRATLRLMFWAKILRMKKGRWVRRVYEAGKAEHEAKPNVKNWASLTHEWLVKLGLEENWKKQQTAEDWQDEVRVRVKQWDEKQWRAGMAKKPKLHLYREWKTDLKAEGYLDEAKDEEGRRQLTKCRAGTLELRVETGRWETVRVRGKEMRLQRNQRICEVCFREVEDETHVLLRCPAYKAARAKVLGGGGGGSSGGGAGREGQQGGAEAGGVGAGWRRAKADNGIFTSNDAEKKANSRMK